MAVRNDYPARKPQSFQTGNSVCGASVGKEYTLYIYRYVLYGVVHNC